MLKTKGLLFVFLTAVLSAVSGGCTSGAGSHCLRQGDCDPGLVCSRNNECVGCGENASCLGIDLVVKTCDPAAPDVFAPPVKTVSIRVEGSGMAPVVRTGPANGRSLVLPELAYGKKRKIIVEGFGEPRGAVLARGESAFFDIEPGTPTSAVSVFVRGTSVFAKTNSSLEPTSCTGLNEPRAGHTATLLSDGRVLIAGGYRYGATGDRVFLQSVERFDPLTGAFEPLDAGLVQARAGHTAHLLPDGRVVFIGGYATQGGIVKALNTAEIYVPSTGVFESVPMQVARMEHASAMLSGGVVVVSGGISEVDGAPLKSIEIFRPNLPAAQAFAFQDDPNLELLFPRAGHAAIAVKGAADRERVLFIGGTSEPKGAAPLDSVEGFGWLGTTLFAEQGTGVELVQARPLPSAVLVETSDARGVFVAGATERGEKVIKYAWDWLALDGKAEPDRVDGLPDRELVTYRYEACVAPLPGGVLVAGGVEASPHSPVQSFEFLDTVNAYRMLPNGSFEVSRTRNKLSSKRKNLACTTLADGAVLVTGGEVIEGGTRTTTSVAEMYLP